MAFMTLFFAYMTVVDELAPGISSNRNQEKSHTKSVLVYGRVYFIHGTSEDAAPELSCILASF